MDWRGIDKGTRRGGDKEKLIQNPKSKIQNPKSKIQNKNLRS